MKHIGLALILFSSCVLAADPGQGKGKGHGKDKGPKGEPPGHAKQAARATVPIFRTSERDIIAGYYRTNPSGLPPGLAKRGGDLPPGLAKQLRRNGTLPPGLQKKLYPLPVDLERQLPPLPIGYRRVIVGQDVIIYDPTTQAIADIIRGVFTLVAR